MRIEGPKPLKRTLAIIAAGVGLAGAAFLGTAHLETHGHYHCYPGPTDGSCVLRYSYWEVGRAWWQIPAAIVLAVVVCCIGVALWRRGETRRSSAPDSRA
jgi:hypothetical protein